MHILCIEDNPGDARIIKEMLYNEKGSDDSITFIDTLLKAEIELKKEIFDVILLDLNLPDSSGLDTFQKMRSLASDLPIIVLTGSQEPQLGESNMVLGAYDFISKNSLSPELLKHSIWHAKESQKFITKLTESELRFKSLIENTTDGIMVISEEGHIKYINPSAENLFGRKKNELLGEVFGFPVQYAETTEINILQAGGKNIIVEMRVSKLFWEGDSCYLAALRNITARKEMEEKEKLFSEQLLNLNQEKDKFFSIIGHDLRSPFSSFLGFTEIMVSDFNILPREKLLPMILTINKAAKSMFELLNNLLEWSLQQQGKITFSPESFPVLTLVQETIDLISDSAKTKNITIFCEIPELLIVKSDAGMIKTILRNLIFNAIKFTKPGGQICITSAKLNNNTVEISVTDTGIGMSPEMIDNLFKLDKNTKRKGTEGEPSTGLGLLICKEYIAKCGGRIQVESEEGKGSRFSFTVAGN